MIFDLDDWTSVMISTQITERQGTAMYYLLVYYCYLSNIPYIRTIYPVPRHANLVTKLCRSPPVRTKLSPSGIPQIYKTNLLSFVVLVLYWHAVNFFRSFIISTNCNHFHMLSSIGFNTSDVYELSCDELILWLSSFINWRWCDGKLGWADGKLGWLQRHLRYRWRWGHLHWHCWHK